jgi:hypothetical protein
MDEMLREPDSPSARRAMRAMFAMKRIDVEALKRAYAGEGSERVASIPAPGG